jgi:hypothetical protein
MGADNQAQTVLDRMAAFERTMVEIATMRDVLGDIIAFVTTRAGKADEATLARWRDALGEGDTKFKFGDHVVKRGGDYMFKGEVRAVWRKRHGLLRYNIENDDGLVHIFNESQLVAK